MNTFFGLILISGGIAAILKSSQFGRWLIDHTMFMKPIIRSNIVDRIEPILFGIIMIIFGISLLLNH